MRTMKRTVTKRTANLKAVEEMGLPTPRLQFRWERITKPKDWYRWFCYYELVLKLGKFDIRNPHEYKKAGELTLPLGGTKVGTTRESMVLSDGSVDTPFRDSSHAVWDSKQLRIKHIYAICGDTVMDVVADRKRLAAERDAAAAR